MTNKRAEALVSLSPLDGRYLAKTIALRDYFSESALIKHRILVEILYLIKLTKFLKKEKLTKKEEKRLLNWQKNLNQQDFIKIKKIEAKIYHDVKAGEYFIKNALKKLKLSRLSSWVHWGLTSEDVNNLAYGLMLKKAKDKILVPAQLQLIKLLLNLAEKYQNVAMLAKTHGQIAVPTTIGKELVVFASRASFFLAKIKKLKFKGKLNGAVGNFNAQKQIFSQKNWLKFSQDFCRQLELEPNLITTQIEPAVKISYFLDLQRQLNNVWLDLSQDLWLYISNDYFKQKINKKEVGSSTMPHKVNPINFENAEGNLQIANSLAISISNKLPISRWQRDLSDSTVKRNLGLVFGYSLLAVNSLIKGLAKISPNKALLKKELKAHPEVLTEALQLILKVWGDSQAYKKIKLKSRGKKITWPNLIKTLTNKQRKILNCWQPTDYLGWSAKLTRKGIKDVKNKLKLKGGKNG